MCTLNIIDAPKQYIVAKYSLKFADISDMKRLCLLFILIIAVSCRDHVFSRPDVIVKGKLVKSYSEKLFLTSQNLYFKYSLPQIIDTIYIEKDSTFKFYSEAEQDVYANLNFRKYDYTLPIYMSEGDSVYLKLNLSANEIIHAGGEVYKKIFFKDSLYQISKSIRDFENKMLSTNKTCNPIMLQSQKTIELFLKKYFREFGDQYPILKTELQNHFELLFDICSLKAFYADSTFDRLVRKYNIKGKVFRHNKAFYHFANLMTDYMTERVGTDSLKTGAESYDRIIDSILAKTEYTFRDVCLISLMERMIPREWSYTDELYILGKRKALEPEMHEEAYRKYLNTLINNHYKFQPGKPFPEFLLQDESTYQYNLYRFRGQKVAVMFRDAGEKDLTELKKFHSIYEKDNNTVSISISLGNEEKRPWAKMMRYFEPGGLNLYEPNGIYSELSKKLLIRDLPMYFEIDENGNILNPGSLDLNELQKKVLAN